MELKYIIYEVKENIARITMNRGDKMNALNHGLWDDLHAAFDEAENDPEVRVIILNGSGIPLETRLRTRRKLPPTPGP